MGYLLVYQHHPGEGKPVSGGGAGGGGVATLLPVAGFTTQKHPE